MSFPGWLMCRSNWDSLFDMDGTLVNSVAGVTAAWEVFAKKYPHRDIDVTYILSCGFFVTSPFTSSAYNIIVYSDSWNPDR